MKPKRGLQSRGDLVSRKRHKGPLLRTERQLVDKKRYNFTFYFFPMVFRPSSTDRTEIVLFYKKI